MLICLVKRFSFHVDYFFSFGLMLILWNSFSCNWRGSGSELKSVKLLSVDVKVANSGVSFVFSASLIRVKVKNVLFGRVFLSFSYPMVLLAWSVACVLPFLSGLRSAQMTELTLYHSVFDSCVYFTLDWIIYSLPLILQPFLKGICEISLSLKQGNRKVELCCVGIFSDGPVVLVLLKHLLCL